MMGIRIYPQVRSGAICQYPIRRRRHYRTITNTLENGTRIALSDPLATTVRWGLVYAGLTDAETTTLKSFFENVEGRLDTFAFVDPVANLLVWSEDFSQSAWQRNSLLQVQPQAADPFGSTRATQVTNTGAGSLTLTQTVQIPETWTSCWSLYMRSNAPLAVTMSRASSTMPARVTTNWQRFEMSNPGNGTGDSSDFSLEISSGAQIEIFGAQVEAQAGASAYMSTRNVSAVYPNTRFDSDTLQISIDAPNSNGCNIALTSHTT
jgi:hypothetical protein